MELHAHLGLFVYTVQYLFVVFLFHSFCVAFYVYRTVKSRRGHLTAGGRGGTDALAGGGKCLQLKSTPSK